MGAGFTFTHPKGTRGRGRERLRRSARRRQAGQRATGLRPVRGNLRFPPRPLPGAAADPLPGRTASSWAASWSPRGS